ncbi:uncharacterized protein LOC110846893 [Folsomia candida]|uniref:Cell adhesion molecule 1 n=1 Tax=Folsomia candida TaxID=158441 RepID=A0A226EIK1_FOLCA|nr:uncharacterized protein LOC110846893 [Folsomia candida]OXA57048.1 Cell adhesion molecule 1 [Folsomia candida]
MGEKLLLCALLANWGLSLRLENVSIPQYGIKDGGVTLGCFFDLEKDTFLVLKWYKDGHEFFRYSEQSTPFILTFPIDGVFVEITQSNMNQVVLRNISLRSSGSYRCEVSADLPSFRTLSQSGELFVTAPPRDLPHIDCHPPLIQQGDVLKCNCTSYASKPAASLMFYLNEGKANFGDMIEYLPALEPYGLETSILGLEFQVEVMHLKNGALRIKCTATIGNGYWVSNVTLYEASVNVNAQPSSPAGPNRLLSGVPRGNGSGGLLTLVVTFLLALLTHLHP